MTYAQIILLPSVTSARVAYDTDTELVYFIPAGVPGSGAQVISSGTAAVQATLAADPDGAKQALGLADEDGNLLVDAIQLNDGSADVLGLGVISGDGNGNVIVGDGVFEGGKVLADDRFHFIGNGSIQTSDLNINLFAHEILGVINLPTAVVQAGQKFRLRGFFTYAFGDNDIVPIQIGLIPSNSWAASALLENPLATGGYGFGFVGGHRIGRVEVQHDFEIAVESGPLLKLQNSGTGLAYIDGGVFGSGLVGEGQTGNTFNYITSAGDYGFFEVPTIDPGAEVLRLFVLVGDGANSTISTCYFNYDLKIDLLP